MILMIDAGNSRIKWARYEGLALEPGLPFPTDPTQSDALFEAAWRRSPPPQSILLSNVAGSAWEAALTEWVERTWACPIRVVSTEAKAFGLVNAYPDANRLGVDRWVAMIGAKAGYGLPFCLIDCGTAVTVDLVDGQGRHRGGWIAAGLALQREALMQRSAGIHVEEKTSSADLGWGMDTASGVALGTLAAIRGLAERALQQAEAALGLAPTLILTGGDAAVVAQGLTVPHRVAEGLVLRGLVEYARAVSRQPR
jgi:type III pantothenate kinase